MYWKKTCLECVCAFDNIGIGYTRTRTLFFSKICKYVEECLNLIMSLASSDISM